MKIIWNKVTWYSKLLAVIVLAGTIWLGFYFDSEFKKVADIKPAVVQNASNVDTSDWKTYRNEKYGFEIKYPIDWIVIIDNDGFTPKINFIPKSLKITKPIIHLNNYTNVSVYPKGVPTQGIYSDSVKSYVNFQAETNRTEDYVLKNGGVWATYATFINYPKNWEPHGFIFSRVVVTNFVQKCESTNPVPDPDDCMVGKGKMTATGSFVDDDRKIQEEILRSFKFTK